MSSATKRLAIIGAAELGLLVAHHATVDSGYVLAGFYDDFNANETFNEAAILGKTEQIIGDFQRGVFDELFVAIGYNHMHVRAELYSKFSKHVPFANIIHSSCYVDPSAKLGTGIFLLPGVTLDMGVHMGNNVLMNTGCTVAHHTHIGDHCFLAPAVQLAGRIQIGEKCFIGIGATIVDCIEVGANATVGAASLVLKNVEPNSISFGNPAKHINYKD